MNGDVRARRNHIGVMNIVGSFGVNKFCSRLGPFILRRRPGSLTSLICLHLGRPFNRGLRGLGHSTTRTFPGRAINFRDLRRGVTSDCGSIHMSHGTALLTTVTVLFVALVKLVNCVGSRLRQHSGRVTVHGIGKTRSFTVLRVLIRSIL